MLVMMVLWMLGSLIAAQPVTRAKAGQTLETGIDWALKMATQQNIDGDFYIGYLVDRPDNEKGQVHFHHKDHEPKDSTTLYEIIYEKKAPKDFPNHVAIFYQYPNNRAGRFGFNDLDMANLGSPMEWTDLDEFPIFWLEKVSLDNSVSFLERGFKRAKAEKLRKEMVTAVGIHGRHPKVFAVLKSIIYGNDGSKIRRDAAFWMSQQKSAEAAKVLLDVVNNDKDMKVRENAVFGLSQVNRKEADDALVNLAKSCKEKQVRKKAIFWLSQRAIKKTAEILEEVIENEDDREVQEAAVFAISQLKEDGVPKLIKLAKTHRSLAVRKKAIFWLGQSDDPRAVKTILDIIEK